MKDNNILSTELYVISFRYITIYHLVFGYINVYSWMSVHTTYPSLYHDIMSAHEINTRLIIVEGLPGSGKSTTAAMVAAELEARGRTSSASTKEPRTTPPTSATTTSLISRVNAPRYSIRGARSRPKPKLIRPMYSIASCCRIRCVRR